MARRYRWLGRRVNDAYEVYDGVMLNRLIDEINSH